MKHVRKGTEDPSRICIGNINDLKFFNHFISIFEFRLKSIEIGAMNIPAQKSVLLQFFVHTY